MKRFRFNKLRVWPPALGSFFVMITNDQTPPTPPPPEDGFFIIQENGFKILAENVDSLIVE